MSRAAPSPFDSRRRLLRAIYALSGRQIVALSQLSAWGAHRRNSDGLWRGVGFAGGPTHDRTMQSLLRLRLVRGRTATMISLSDEGKAIVDQLRQMVGGLR